MAFRFVHAADLHLDSALGGLGEAAPAIVAAAVRRATLDAWARIVELAVAERVDFVVVAGDVFETADRTIRGQLAFVDGLAALDRAGIPSFVVTGNHDPLSGWEPSLRWPASAFRFGAERVEARPVVRDGVEIARVYGISYPVRDVRENLAARFRKEPGAPFAVAVLHANVGAQPGHANYAPCSLPDLEATGIDYWALGHVHRPAVLRDGRPVVAYAGNPQGRDTGEADPRGAFLVSVDDAGHAVPSFRPLDAIRWTSRTIDVAGIDDLDALLRRLDDELDAAVADAGRPVIARLELAGFGPLHAELRRAGTLRELRERLVERHASREPFAWVVSLRDATRPEEARAIERAGEFLGELGTVVAATAARLASGAIPAPGSGGGNGHRAPDGAARMDTGPVAAAERDVADGTDALDVVAIADEVLRNPSVQAATRLRDPDGRGQLDLDDPAQLSALLERARQRIVDELAARE